MRSVNYPGTSGYFAKSKHYVDRSNLACPAAPYLLARSFPRQPPQALPPTRAKQPPHPNQTTRPSAQATAWPEVAASGTRSMQTGWRPYMATSERTFDQVKSILGKLDRNIDVARARRIQEGLGPRINPGSPSSVNGVYSAQSVSTPTSSVAQNPAQPILASPAAVAPVPAKSKSGFGRAQPLRRAMPPTVLPSP